MIKLFATDLDGTLLNSNHEYDNRYTDVIQQLEKQGIQFVVATGRPLSSIRALFRESGLSFLKIGLNGAIAEDADGNVVYRKPMQQKDVEDFFKKALEHDLPLSIYGEFNSYSNAPMRVYEDIFEHVYKKKNVAYEDMKDGLREFFDGKELIKVNGPEDVYKLGDDIYKVEFQLRSSQADLQKEIYEYAEAKHSVDVATSGMANVEITNIDAQKGLAVEFFANKLNVDHDDVLVIGDSFNDISMLSRFKNSYAMGQADERIKRIANFEAKSNVDFGVLDIMQKLLDRN